VIPKKLTDLLDPVIDPIGDGFGIPPCDIEPDVEKVFAGAARVTNLAHTPTL